MDVFTSFFRFDKQDLFNVTSEIIPFNKYFW